MMIERIENEIYIYNWLYGSRENNNWKSIKLRILNGCCRYWLKNWREVREGNLKYFCWRRWNGFLGIWKWNVMCVISL